MSAVPAPDPRTEAIADVVANVVAPKCAAQIFSGRRAENCEAHMSRAEVEAICWVAAKTAIELALAPELQAELDRRTKIADTSLVDQPEQRGQ